MIRFAVSRPVTICCVIVVTAAAFAEDPMPKVAPGEEVPPMKASPAAEQLTKIVESMRAIETRLKDRETGDDTQTAQQEVIDQLDKLLKMPPEPPSPSGSGGGGNNSNPPPSSQGGSGQSQKPQGAQSKAQNKPQSDPGQMRPKPASQQGGKERQSPKDSEERSGPNRPTNSVAAKRQRLEVDVWGHLPEKLREQLLNSYGERILPQYEEAVRRFYDQLADPAASRPKR